MAGPFSVEPGAAGPYGSHVATPSSAPGGSPLPVLHVTNGDAVVPEIAAAAGVDPGDVLVWRDVLHDGPVPAGLDADALAQVRARHLTARSSSQPLSECPRTPR